MSATKELLRRLAAHDERCVRALLLPASCLSLFPPPSRPLSRGTRVLVELAALLAMDAPTPSVRWAVDRAAATGADDQTLVQVLGTAAGAAGAAQTVKSASRLALALDLDADFEPSREDRPPRLG